MCVHHTQKKGTTTKIRRSPPDEVGIGWFPCTRCIIIIVIFMTSIFNVLIIMRRRYPSAAAAAIKNLDRFLHGTLRKDLLRDLAHANSTGVKNTGFNVH